MNDDRSFTRFSDLLRTAAAPFALAALASAGCSLAAGQTLGFYLGPVIGAALLVPPLAARESRPLPALLAAGSVADAIGVAWLIAVFASDLTFVQWLLCYLTVAAFAIALCGVAWASTRLLGAVAAAALTTILALAWLAWPVWLSPHLSGTSGATVAGWLSPAHPLLAVNHVMIDLGVWTQQRLMYGHTALGQDVPFTLPRSVWPCVVVHALTGLALLWAARYPGRRRPRPAETSVAAAEV